MAYPPGVSLATITIGAARTMFGAAPKRISATVTPIFTGTPHVVHAASGWAFYPTPRTFEVQNGEELTFELPHVNAEGWRDTSGNEFPALLPDGTRDRGWAYHVRFTIIGGSGQDSIPHRYEKVFQPLTGQTEPIDVDLVPDGKIGAPVSAPAVTVTSIAGLTGPVTEEQLRALGLGGLGEEDVEALAMAAADQAVIDAGTYTDEAIGGVRAEVGEAGYLTDVPDVSVADLVNGATSVTRGALNSAFAGRGQGEFYASRFPSIQAAVDAAAQRPGGGVVHVTESATIAAPITLHPTRPVSLIGRADVVISAGAPMPAMIQKPAGWCVEPRMHALNLDGRMLADRLVDFEQALRLSIQGGIWSNAKVCPADFGRNGGQVYEMGWKDTRIVGIDDAFPGATPAQMPAYGYRLGTNCTDNVMDNVVVKNADVKVLDQGVANNHNNGHVFGYPFSGANNYVGSCGYRSTGTLNQFNNCYPDTEVLGFDLVGPRNTVNNPRFFWPTGFEYAGDLVGVRFGENGNMVIGGGVRLPYATPTLKGYFIDVGANVYRSAYIGVNVYGPWTNIQRVAAGSNAPISVGNVWDAGTAPTNLGTLRGLTAENLSATGTSTLGITNIVGGALNVQSGDSRLSGNAGTNRDHKFLTGGSNRFAERVDNSAESGSDNGSRFVLIAYTDAGAFKYNAMEVDRKHGVPFFPQGLATRVKAGAPVDADFGHPPNNGTMVVDSTGSLLWVRVNGVWKSSPLT